MSRSKFFYGSEPDWEQDEEQVEFEVGKILDVRKGTLKVGYKYGKEYLIKWKGYPL